VLGRGARFPAQSTRDYRDGEEVFHDGDQSREMYMIQTGTVEISRKVDDGRVVLATLVKGAIFGEMALLESLPRTATATARGPTRLVVLQPGGFLLKIRRDPTFGFELLQQLSGRLRKANERLESMVHEGDPESSAVFLRAAFTSLQDPD
jgi:CRP/FNR family cyclic AMP-dependent transcriptional regulator